MIEDSLKTVRNLHRLVMTISFITLVFSLSLSLPSDKQQQLNQIETLVNFKFSKYEEFVNKKIEENMSTKYEAIASSIAASIDKGKHMIFNLSNISEVFNGSPHVGKLLIDELILSNPTNTSLNKLETLNGLPLGRDVQIVVPKIHEITPFD